MLTVTDTSFRDATDGFGVGGFFRGRLELRTTNREAATALRNASRWGGGLLGRLVRKDHREFLAPVSKSLPAAGQELYELRARGQSASSIRYGARDARARSTAMQSAWKVGVRSPATP